MHAQVELYGHVLRSKAVSSLLAGCGATGSGADALSVITTLRKLCNHPDLLHSAAVSDDATGNGSVSRSAAEELQQRFPADYERGDSSQSGRHWTLTCADDIGALWVLVCLQRRRGSYMRLVLVSGTSALCQQTLDHAGILHPT